MKYFFVLGNNPTLSTAELTTIFGKTAKNFELPQPNVLFLTINKINARKTIKRLGGTVKIGQINGWVNKKDSGQIYPLIKKFPHPEVGKFKFGISYYGRFHLTIKKMAMEIKKYLRAKNITCRWVTSREKTLSSVVVEQNKLTGPGEEIILIESDDKIIIGQTLAVQPFKELSWRDYGRPARDDYAGMLPPKLAQIMINLSGTKKGTILDPFCGSGTVLTEAMLMGHKNLIGSDISSKAVADTKKNIKWIEEKYSIFNIQYSIYCSAAAELSKKIKQKSIRAIITEPHLGPQRGKIDIKKTKCELETLYTQSLRVFNRILKPTGRVVMVWPVFRQSKTWGKNHLTPALGRFDIINPIPEKLRRHKFIKLSDRNTIIYGRPDQKIWREIVILKKCYNRGLPPRFSRQNDAFACKAPMYF